MTYNLSNKASTSLDTLTPLIHRFVPYAQRMLKYDKPVNIELVSDADNARDPLGKTAHYDPAKLEVVIYTDNRHPKDILRSLSHELVHHAQNCRGEFDKPHHAGEGYIKKDPHLQNMEGEAYLLGNGFIIRFFEEHMKENGFMTEGRNKMKVRILNEGRTPASGGPGHASHGRGNKEEEVTLEEVEDLLAELNLDEEALEEEDDLGEVRTGADGRVSPKGGSHGRGVSEPDIKLESIEDYRLARKKMIADELMRRLINN
jgi:hypothetical protein